MSQSEEVLTFWFGDACASPELATARSKFWFKSDTETDQQVWELYADVVTDAGGGLYDYWQETPKGRLALIILLDQFPRNIFRGTSEVYRYDSKALTLAGQGITVGHLAGLSIPEQAFFLMPYQHSEDIAVQRVGVDLMAAMVASAPQELKPVAQGNLDFATRHHDIVAEYGRFPHRNSLLGRNSTEAESQFLQTGGERFGQAG